MSYSDCSNHVTEIGHRSCAAFTQDFVSMIMVFILTMVVVFILTVFMVVRLLVSSICPYFDIRKCFSDGIVFG